jgi:phage terminase small subunit
MPTPKKSLAELTLSGTLQQNRKRYAHLTSPVPTITTPIGRPPTHLLAIEKQAWLEIARTAPSGLLQRADRVLLEITSKLVVRMRSADVKPAELNALISVLNKLGMTPHSRSKMDLPLTEIPAGSSAAQCADEAAWDALAELD